MSSIYESMNKIMGELGAIPKNKQMQAGNANYKFRGIDDLYNALNSLMVKHEVFCAPRITERTDSVVTTAKGTTMYRVCLTINYVFYSKDSSSFECSMAGEAMDSGDKATSKAASMAHKYALLQTFCVPTEDIHDSDDEYVNVNDRDQTSFVKEKPKAPAPVPNRAPQISMNGDPGSYVVQCGKKYLGKKLSEITDQDIKKYIDYLEESSQRERKPLTGHFLDFVMKAEAYLNGQA